MGLLQDKALLITVVLLVLIVIEGLIIYLQYKNSSKSRKRSKGGHSGSFSKEKYEKVCKERDKFRSEANQFKSNHDKIKSEYNSLYSLYLQEKEKYGKVCLDFSLQSNAFKKLKKENDELKQIIRDLSCDNGKKDLPTEKKQITKDGKKKPSLVPTSNTSEQDLEEGNSNDDSKKTNPSSVQDSIPTNSFQDVESTKADNKTENSTNLKETPEPEQKTDSSKEKVMYASFPRSAGNSNYFSDLSENLADDSYFELRITIASGKATFKPLDFMKIRNYDPAMSAMLTEGVKPNVASAVVGIEPGKAHVEGKDWIIDNLAKIKLA